MVRKHAALILLVASAVTVAASPAVAQPVPVAERAARLGALFSDLGPAELRVETSAGRVESGVLGPVRPEAFVLDGIDGPLTIDYRDVQAVAREGGHGIQGAIWGGAAGALAGAFFGVMIHSYDCVTPVACNASENRGGVRGAVIVGTVGAVTGYLLGRRQSHWHPIYP